MARDSKVDVYMPVFIGDYLADTMDLNAEEHGAYLLLLMDLWKRDGRIEYSPEKLQRICRVTPRRWDIVWASLTRFFEVRDGILSQGRLCHELAVAYGKREQASRGGKASADARKAKNGTAQPSNGRRTEDRTDAEQTVELKPEQKPKSSPSPSSSPLPSEDLGGVAGARDPGATPTGYLDLAGMFGRVRHEVLNAGTEFQSVRMGQEAIRATSVLAEEIRAAAEVPQVEPSMRLFFQRVKSGEYHGLENDSPKAFGRWRSLWPNLRDDLTGNAAKVAPIARASPGRGHPSTATRDAAAQYLAKHGELP